MNLRDRALLDTERGWTGNDEKTVITSVDEARQQIKIETGMPDGEGGERKEVVTLSFETANQVMRHISNLLGAAGYHGGA